MVENCTRAYSSVLRLTIIGAMLNMLGNTGYTACAATGNIRRYVLWISTIGCLVFPLTWVAYKFGLPAESTYIIFILVYIGVNFVRLYIMRGLLRFPITMFVNEVILKIFLVTIVSVLLPFLVHNIIEESFLRLVLVLIICIVASGLSTYKLGLSMQEKKAIKRIIFEKYIEGNEIHTYFRRYRCYGQAPCFDIEKGLWQSYIRYKSAETQR